MNLELSEVFCQNYPEQLDGTLDCTSIAVTMSFNKRGTLLAVGCNDGRIVIWDFLTRVIAKIISAHVHPICSLSWSRSGRRLLSSSTDNNVCIWDVLTSDCLRKHRFPCPTLIVQFDPKNEMQFLASPMQHQPLVIDSKSQHTILPLGEDKDPNIIAVFDRKGRYIYMGNSKGAIMVLDVENFNFLSKFRIFSANASTISVKSIEFCKKGKYFLVNCSDRVIRVYDNKEVLEYDKVIEPIVKLQDLINKSMWKKCTFSGDGEFICAGSARQHSIYIWERTSGSLVKILHGAKVEVFLDVVWHPSKPMVASIGSGLISIWAQNHVETWSAFAPGFKELDENLDYEERESEFDIEDEDKSMDNQEDVIDKSEEEEVDIMTVDVGSTYGSSDDDSDHVELDILPLVPEIEMPEEWEQTHVRNNIMQPPTPVSREKSAGYPRVEPVVTPTNSGLKLKIKLGGTNI